MFDGGVDHAHGENDAIKLRESGGLVAEQRGNDHQRSHRHQDGKDAPVELMRHHDAAGIARHEGDDREKQFCGMGIEAGLHRNGGARGVAGHEGHEVA
ncbi:hypothetical protein D3C72_1642720 [compost metagenome]